MLAQFPTLPRSRGSVAGARDRLCKRRRARSRESAPQFRRRPALPIPSHRSSRRPRSVPRFPRARFGIPIRVHLANAPSRRRASSTRAYIAFHHALPRSSAGRRRGNRAPNALREEAVPPRLRPPGRRPVGNRHLGRLLLGSPRQRPRARPGRRLAGSPPPGPRSQAPLGNPHLHRHPPMFGLRAMSGLRKAPGITCRSIRVVTTTGAR